MTSQCNFDPALTSAMRSMSRTNIAEIWRRGESGELLTGEDMYFYQAMKEHPEYNDYWEHAAELSGKDVTTGGVNPFLHVSLHSVIERQIADSNPPETAQAVFRLTRAGLDRHEAVHAIATLVAEMIQGMLHARRPFDTSVYCRRLRALKP